MTALADVLLAMGAEDVAFVERCTAPVDFDHDEDGYFPSDYCGRSAVDDADEPRCEEHLEGWNREGLPEFNGAFR